MSDSSITLILNRLRDAVTEEQRQSAATELYDCYRGQVENVARGRLAPGGGVADEEDIAQSAFRSFFDRIETGQLDALVNGGQAWAILARLTRNKAIDTIRYENAKRRGGQGGRSQPSNLDSESSAPFSPLRPIPGQSSSPVGLTPLSEDLASASHVRFSDPAAGKDVPPGRASYGCDVRSGTTSTNERSPSPHGVGRSRLGIGDAFASASESLPKRDATGGQKREEVPLDAVQDRTQRCGAETAASKEAVERFLERLNEATLRGIVTLKLQGFTNQEIGDRLGCATRTVERKLGLIRRLWIPILEDSGE